VQRRIDRPSSAPVDGLSRTSEGRTSEDEEAK
jgi:hypothetical protein